jgi:exopolysaccharide biosynthesis WecB/TagA/CpsF family protein
MSSSEKASEALAGELARAVSEGRRFSVGWLNHYTAQVVLGTGTSALSELSIIGIDGLFLLGLLRGHERTSADLVVPSLFERLEDPRVIVVGGVPEMLEERRDAIQRLLGHRGSVVAAFDGYAGRPDPGHLRDLVHDLRANVVLMGLGAPMQEAYAAAVAPAFERGGVALTVGGFLDQIAQPGYYPAWAYPLSLNWLVRLYREPRRMWRRYSVDALRAARLRRRLRSELLGLPAIRL